MYAPTRIPAYVHARYLCSTGAFAPLLWPKPCVPVIPAVTRPSNSKAFGAGQRLLDTVWTRTHARACVFSARGGPWGEPGAAVHA